jgi:hypothetical protein
MNTIFQDISFLVLAGAILLAGLFILRFVLKFAWKIVRVALILISVILVAGYFTGFLDIVIR